MPSNIASHLIILLHAIAQGPPIPSGPSKTTPGNPRAHPAHKRVSRAAGPARLESFNGGRPARLKRSPEMSAAQLAKLLPLPEQELEQVLEYASTLSKAEAAGHLSNLLGDSPQAV